MKVLSFTNEIVEINFESYLKNKRVLLCSICRLAQNLTEKYIKFLSSRQTIFKERGIDEICLINSCDGKFGLYRIYRIASNLVSFHDVDLEVISWLSSQLNKKQNINDLAKFWSYQVLLNDGLIEKFFEQPTENQRNDLLKQFKNLHSADVKNLLNQSDEMIFNRLELRNKKEQTYEYGGKIFYYNLWPNIALENYLGLSID